MLLGLASEEGGGLVSAGLAVDVLVERALGELFVEGELREALVRLLRC